MIAPLPAPTLFPYTTLFRSVIGVVAIATVSVFTALVVRWRWVVLVLLLEGRSVGAAFAESAVLTRGCRDRKSTRLNSSHLGISYAVFWLKKKSATNAQLNGV